MQPYDWESLTWLQSCSLPEYVLMNKVSSYLFPVFACCFRSYAPWLLRCFISSSCLHSAGFWQRHGSPTWQWQAASGIASYASVSCVSAGVGFLSHQFYLPSFFLCLFTLFVPFFLLFCFLLFSCLFLSPFPFSLFVCVSSSYIFFFPTFPGYRPFLAYFVPSFLLFYLSLPVHSFLHFLLCVVIYHTISMLKSIFISSQVSLL